MRQAPISVEIHSLMLCVSICTWQLKTYWDQCFLKGLANTLIKQLKWQIKPFSSAHLQSDAIGLSPGIIVLHCDMLYPIPLIIRCNQLRERYQVVIDDNNRRANLQKSSHDYQLGQEILVLTYRPDRVQSCTVGPFTIERVHVNGANIRRNPNVTERVNIRRVRPYHRNWLEIRDKYEWINASDSDSQNYMQDSTAYVYWGEQRFRQYGWKIQIY